MFIRGKRCPKRLKFKFLLLWMSTCLVSILPFLKDRTDFFVLESIIFGLQFTVLLYSVFADAGDVMAYFRQMLAPSDTLKK